MRRASISPKLVTGLLLLGLIAWALYHSIEFYDETVTSRWSSEAIRNPYLAAQQFMQRSGIEVTDADSLIGLDKMESVGTLFISNANQIQSPRQLKHILSWLERGGHVIYTASSVAHEDDLLLAEFDVEVDWRSYDNDEEAEDKPLSETFREYNRQIREGKTREEIAKSFGQNEESLTRVEFDDDIGTLQVRFEVSKILKHPYISGTGYDVNKPRPESWSYSDYGNHLMQFDVGEGLLTIISDPKIWTSVHIDAYDHAFLLWTLSSGEGGFAMLRPVLQDSIWKLIADYGFEFLIALAILLGLWIWHLGSRFGRIDARDLARTRALGEHFSSISHYLWHRRQGAYLLEPLRQQILRRASLTLGEFSLADEKRQFELIASRVEITAEAVARAMTETEFNESSFVQRVKLLKRIEQSL